MFRSKESNTAKQESAHAKKPEIRAILEKHADENLPVFPNAKLAIVVPAYRELSNGNAAQLLASLAVAGIPKNEVAVIFVINNPLSDSLIHQYLNDDPNKSIFDIKLNIEEEYISRDFVNGQPARELWRSNRQNASDMVRRFGSVRQNIVLYEILRRIESSHNATPQRKQEVLEEVIAIWRKFSQNPLPLGFELAIKKDIQITAVDNFSPENAPSWRAVGLQRREGITLAFERITPNAKLVHPSDADTFFTASQINYLLDKSEGDYDAIVLQQYSVLPIHPEQITKEDQLLETLMVNYFKNIIQDVAKYASVSGDRLGGSQLAISRHTYQRYSYPSVVDSDFAFSNEVLNDEKLKLLRSYEHDNILILGNRSRPESFDGRSILEPGLLSYPEKILNTQEREKNLFICDALIQHMITCNYIKFGPDHEIDIMELYQENLEKFYNLVKRDRRVFRRQAKMTIKLLCESLLENPEFNQLPEKMLTQNRRLAEFLIKNPLLFKLITDEIKNIIIHNPDFGRDQIIEILYAEFLEQYFNEYFIEHDDNLTSVENLSKMFDEYVTKEEALPTEAKATSFLHIFLAAEAVLGYFHTHTL